MTKLYLLAPFFLLLIHTPGRADSTSYHMTEAISNMPFKKVEKLVFVEASIDGEAGYFLFDTGVGGLTLNELHFGEREDLGQMVKITDVNGRKKWARGAYIHDFEWGGLKRSKFVAPLLDMSGLEAILKIKILGLMGHKVYRNVEVHIDYDTEEMSIMRLDSRGVPEASPYVEKPKHEVFFSMEYFLPVIQARIGGLNLNMGWDSGASINMLDRRLRRDLPADARKLMRIAYGGVLSQSKAPFIAVNAIHLDDQFKVIAWRMAATSMKHFSKKDIQIDGLIGADLFRLGSVSINYKQRKLSIWVNDNLFSNRYELMLDGEQLSGATKVVAAPE